MSRLQNFMLVIIGSTGMLCYKAQYYVLANTTVQYYTVHYISSVASLLVGVEWPH